MGSKYACGVVEGGCESRCEHVMMQDSEIGMTRCESDVSTCESGDTNMMREWDKRDQRVSQLAWGGLVEVETGENNL